jgi:signal transduction histidine kinase
MNNLIDVFLMLARESQLSQDETAHAWPLEPVIREILDGREEDLKHKGLAVELQANGHPQIRAPRAVLIVVFSNLLGNAIAYTKHGGIRITLDEQGATVEDTGVGIAEKDEAHIFRRAYRSRESAAQGRGLGLAIVQRLCQRCGWRIRFDSTEGQGTRIWLAFSP